MSSGTPDVKVSLVTGEYPPMRGGVADYTALLATGLSRLGVDVTVLTSKRAAANAVGGTQVEAVVDSWGPRAWTIIGRHIARFKPDLLHIQYQTGAFDMRLGVNFLPWLNRIAGGQPPVVVTYHDLKEPYILPKIGSTRHLATHLLTFGSDAVIVTNPEDLARVSAQPFEKTHRWLGRRRVAAIPIGSNIPAPRSTLDLALVKERLRARPDEVLLTYFGFIGPGKGVDDLVTAFALLVEGGLPVRLIMVGAATGDTGHADRGYENSIRQRLDHHSLRGRVSWTGFLSPSDVGAYLSAGDVCCLPFRDGVSIRHGTLIAAIESGVPIVSTRAVETNAMSALPRLIPGENILLVDPINPASLSSGIARLISDGNLRQVLRAGARALAPAFDWGVISRDTLSVYEKVLARRDN